MTPPDDLVLRCQSGDRRAFRELFDLHRDQVVRLVHRMGARRTDVEDLVQEVFLQVHRSLKDFRGQSRLSTWLHRVTVNVVLMHRCAGRSRPVLVSELIAEPPHDVAPLPDDQLARKNRIDAFYRLLDKLSEKKRTVYILHELEGLSPTEIATIVDAPVLTVRTRLFYARRDVARLLHEEPALVHVAQGFTDEDASAVSSAMSKGPAE